MSRLARFALGGLVSWSLAGSLGCARSYLYLHEPNPTLEQRRSSYVQHNPASPFGEDILAGRIRVGMTRVEVVASWGHPDEVQAGPKREIDLVYAYREDEPSRGDSVYLLQFRGELLSNIEVSRGHVLVDAPPRSREPEPGTTSRDPFGRESL